MAEIETEVSCDNCGSQYTLIYDTDNVSYDAEHCPFCADIVNIQEDEEWDDNEEDDEDTLH
jgi:hypothetical protein